MEDKLIIRKVHRIGVLSIVFRNNKYYAICQNRTYYKEHEFPKEKLDRWIRLVKTGE